MAREWDFFLCLKDVYMLLVAYKNCLINGGDQGLSLKHLLCLHVKLVLFQGAFSEFALFFYDKYGGTFIAAVWKPAAFVPQPFKVHLMMNYLVYMHIFNSSSS